MKIFASAALFDLSEKYIRTGKSKHLPVVPNGNLIYLILLDL